MQAYPLTICGVKFKFFLNITCPLQHNIMCTFTRQLPEKHHVSVVSQKVFSCVCFSKTSSHKTASRKISHHIPEFPKKPEISTLKHQKQKGNLITQSGRDDFYLWPTSLLGSQLGVSISHREREMDTCLFGQ